MNDRAHIDPNRSSAWVSKPTPSELFRWLGPGTVEMAWGRRLLSGYLTPNAAFYVHNHGAPPEVDLAAWRLMVQVEGVPGERAFTYQELTCDLPAVAMVRAMACAGNGAAFYPKLPPEDPGGDRWRPLWGRRWRLGAVGVAEFTGVRLRDVLTRAGCRSGDQAGFVTITGLDRYGADPKPFARYVPLAKAWEDDSLLIWAMNGEPLPRDHGFPLRAFFSGWTGDYHVKWVERLAVTRAEPTTGGPPKLKGPAYADEGEPGSSIAPVNSALELDWDADLTAGPILLRGRSWSGHGAIARVELSFDGGAQWQPARLQEPNLPQAWVRWECLWQATPGRHEIRVRATDDQGHPQPAALAWNEGGVGFHGIVAHPVTVAPAKA